MKNLHLLRYLLFFALISLCSLFSACKKSSDPVQDKKDIRFRKSLVPVVLEINSAKKSQRAALDNFISSMSPVDKVRELFIVNLEGNRVFKPVEKLSALGPDFEKFVEFPDAGAASETGFVSELAFGAAGNAVKKSSDALVPGGFIFFSYNLAENIEEIMSFTDSVRAWYIERGLVPPYLTLDQEGGFVNRLRTVNGPLPSCQRVRENLSLEQALELYTLQAKEMKALGFDMNLAPVSEVLTSDNEKFLNGRSFGSVSDVLLYSRVFLNGMQNQNVYCVLKHFPGNTNVDPHSGLPELPYSFERLMNDTLPFKEFAFGAVNASCVLMSHARTKALDPETPACLSEKWVKDVLRKDYGFEGIVFSDDIFMKALNENGYPPEKAVVMAVKAGVDVIMISEKRFASSARVILDLMLEDSDFNSEVERAVRHVLEYKIKAGLLKYQRVSGKNAVGDKTESDVSEGKSEGSGSEAQPRNEASSVKNVIFEKARVPFVLVPASPYGKITDRIVYFRDAYKENVDFYISNFR